MANCLEQGSLSSATVSTNMNNQSSRSHTIFTITVEQIRKVNFGNNLNESMSDEYLCAKLHLVDLDGPERVKRTDSDGMRFKEGVHINKGLLLEMSLVSLVMKRDGNKMLMFHIVIVNLLANRSDHRVTAGPFQANKTAGLIRPIRINQIAHSN
ncbi:hypothetical protein L1987_59512 [Smallanthus sonchifolius]|uniref:Uncharacterized protein n=1 Tax=Smallanthus sonchifolius TaxID=185202 RepID=A0ACB9D5G0_9ASTR|nr:hypothetical protein L1987_59512 [Smallanthus sonchifolius]